MKEETMKKELIELLKNSFELNREMSDLMLLQSIKLSEIFIEYYELEIKNKNKYLANLIDKEPHKFFKTLHSEWKQRVNELGNEIEDVEKKLFEERSLICKNQQLLYK